MKTIELHDDNEVRQALLQVVKQKPGIHFRSLGRAAEVSSAGQLRHHLDRLQRQGQVVEIEDGRYKRYFIAGEHKPHLRPGMARFARAVPRQIAKLLLVQPMNRTELRRRLGCADSTLGYHLKRMVAIGDLEKQRGRNCCLYSLKDPELVRTFFLSQETERVSQPRHPAWVGDTPRPVHAVYRRHAVVGAGAAAVGADNPGTTGQATASATPRATTAQTATAHADTGTDDAGDTKRAVPRDDRLEGVGERRESQKPFAGGDRSVDPLAAYGPVEETAVSDV